MAQMSLDPAAIEVTLSMAVGTGRSLAVCVPLPSSPLPLSPQHHTEPFDFRAQAWKNPAATWTTPVRPGTGCGVLASAVLPSPSSPTQVWF